MQRLLAAVVTVAWALWFGGVVMLLLAVSSIFHTFTAGPTVEALGPFGVSTEAAVVPNSPLRRVLAGAAASGVFHRFERYQLVLAAVALLATFGWRLVGPPRGIKTALFSLLALATVAAVVTTAHITPKEEAIRVESLRRGQDVNQSPRKAEFGKLHGLSMALYTGQAAVLLLAGLLLPFATPAAVGNAVKDGSPPPRTSATAPPA
jgi:hypothetical protein